MEIRKISDNVEVHIPEGFKMYSGDLKTTPTIDYGVIKIGSFYNDCFLLVNCLLKMVELHKKKLSLHYESTRNSIISAAVSPDSRKRPLVGTGFYRVD